MRELFRFSIVQCNFENLSRPGRIAIMLLIKEHIPLRCPDRRNGAWASCGDNLPKAGAIPVHMIDCFCLQKVLQGHLMEPGKRQFVA